MSIEDYERAFEPLLPPDKVFETARHLLDTCPITHSVVDGGFWVANTYDDNFQILTDWEHYAVGRLDAGGSLRVPADPPGVDRPLFPPIDVNPPVHRAYRALINPYLTPQSLTRHESGFRRIIANLLDECVADGHCDLATSFAKVFPAQATFVELFGIADSEELSKARGWIRALTYGIYREEPEVLGRCQRELSSWILDLVAERREKTEVENLLDALVHGQIDGRPLNDKELIGTIQLLIMGGFSTTADATCNLVINLIDHPGLEDRLRAEPDLIKPYIEEILRLDPQSRRERGAVRVMSNSAGHNLPMAIRVVLNFVAANRDPAEFERPDELDLSRGSNRHLSFSAGVHRCVGSTMARMTLTIMLEELLARVRNIRFAPGQREERVSFSIGVWRAVDTLPIEFDVIALAEPSQH